MHKIERTGESITYKDWNHTLQASFESHFWIPTSSDDDFYFNVNPPLVNRYCTSLFRLISKDEVFIAILAKLVKLGETTN